MLSSAAEAMVAEKVYIHKWVKWHGKAKGQGSAGWEGWRMVVGEGGVG